MADNQNVGLKQQGSLVQIIDTGNGNARLRLNSVSAKEFMGRDARYVETVAGALGPVIILESGMIGN
ncbi:hypothetical protein ABIB99_001907 [Bradyrhizobium sp. LA6.1]|uniref:hypothetical protein n=1 Tax=Bradyrhizobium sp. LA6.1 TaxID=3156378 RepID=UPI003395E435